MKRATFVVDRDGIVRFRQVSRTGARFTTVGEIERALAALA